MKPRLSNRHETGMTLFEVGVIVSVLLIVVAVLLPNLRRPRTSTATTRLNCVNHLKQIGLAYRIWEGDNGDFFPMGVSVTNGGSMEMVSTGNMVQSFLVVSNELSTPKILCCPADRDRERASVFGGLANSNVSYFVGVDATNGLNPEMILSGDCNFELGGVPVKAGLLFLWTNDPVAWAATRHVHTGNLGLADGSVQQSTSSAMRNYLA